MRHTLIRIVAALLLIAVVFVALLAHQVLASRYIYDGHEVTRQQFIVLAETGAVIHCINEPAPHLLAVNTNTCFSDPDEAAAYNASR